MKHIIFLLFPIGYLNAFLVNNALNPYEPLAPSSIAKSLSGQCVDRLHTGSCENYGPQMCYKYREWAYTQCPQFCLLCERCHLKPADLIFVLDGSGSVGPDNFNISLEFVKAFVQEFEISNKYVQIGIISYSDKAFELVQLQTGSNNQTLLSKIDLIQYPGGNTNTGEAIRSAMDQAFTSSHGDRDYVTNVMMVITDGQSQDRNSTIRAAKNIHRKGIKTFAIGVGNRVSTKEINAIASDTAHVFHVSNFKALFTLREELRNKTCEDIMFSMLTCKDKILSCASYGTDVCKSYSSWSKENCAFYCGHCSFPTPPTPSKVATLPPQQSTSGTTACINNIQDCSSYGSSVCGQYAEWSKQNCAQFCGFCQGPSSPPPVTHASTSTSGPPSPPPVTHTPVPTGGAPTPFMIKNCRDINPDCSSHGPSVCGQYIEWSKSNCAKYCGFCSGPSSSQHSTLWVTVPKHQQP